MENCTFRNLTITAGKGDDGTAAYVLGDLFGKGTGNQVNNCTVEGIKFEASGAVKKNLVLE